VYFEGTETENGTVMLSHAKAEKFKVWRELDKAFQSETPVEGVVLGKVKGGLKVDIGVPAFLPGSHVDIRPARNLDRYVGQRWQISDSEIQPRPAVTSWSRGAACSSANVRR